MRLKQHRHAFIRPGSTNPGKRCRNLVRMMAIVVDVHDTAVGYLQLVAYLTAPTDPGEFGQRFADGLARHAELPGNAR